MRAFQLVRKRYREVSLPHSQVWIESLGIGLGVWQGYWLKQERQWLRWFTRQGEWIRTNEEQERAIRLQAQQQALQAQQRADRLAQRLRDLGIDPDQI
jgi:hypothetical protein